MKDWRVLLASEFIRMPQFWTMVIVRLVFQLWGTDTEPPTKRTDDKPLTAWLCLWRTLFLLYHVVVESEYSQKTPYSHRNKQCSSIYCKMRFF